MNLCLLNKVLIVNQDSFQTSVFVQKIQKILIDIV